MVAGRTWFAAGALLLGCTFDTGGLGGAADADTGTSGGTDGSGAATSVPAGSSGGGDAGGQTTSEPSGTSATTQDPSTTTTSSSGGAGSTGDPGTTTGVEPGEPISTFTDDFEDGVVDPRWSLLEMGSCSLGESNGAARFSANGGGPSRCAFVSVDAYDIRGSSMSLDVPQITSFHDPLRTFFALSTADGDLLEFGFDGSDVFYLSVSDDDMEVQFDTSVYVPRPRYWQIREAAGQLYLESSDAPPAWDVEFQISTPFDLAAAYVSFGVSTSNTMPSSIGIGVPNFNILP